MYSVYVLSSDSNAYGQCISQLLGFVCRLQLVRCWISRFDYQDHRYSCLEIFQSTITFPLYRCFKRRAFHWCIGFGINIIDGVSRVWKGTVRLHSLSLCCSVLKKSVAPFYFILHRAVYIKIEFYLSSSWHLSAICYGCILRNWQNRAKSFSLPRSHKAAY